VFEIDLLYRERMAASEQAVARLRAELSERNYIREMVQITANQLINIDLHWENAADEERPQFARNLFTEIVYDLDARRIVGFKVKAWQNYSCNCESRCMNFSHQTGKKTRWNLGVVCRTRRAFGPGSIQTRRCDLLHDPYY
jgi:hypothetical protein